MIRLIALNDTIMNLVNEKQKYILEIIREGEHASSGAIWRKAKQDNKDISLITLKRELSKLVREGYLKKEGLGRATKYSLLARGYIFLPIEAKNYCVVEQDKRRGRESYNFDLFPSLEFDLFSQTELKELDQATLKYQQKAKMVSNAIYKKELERFIIELSWKSSKIEGNTYTLLDTEKLIQKNIPATGHPKDEAIMILNHKKAFEFIWENRKRFTKNLKIYLLEEIHKILVGDLKVKFHIRKSPVGILGTNYKPLDNEHQIREALDKLLNTANSLKDPYSKALLILLGISYLQPFEDGNKRASRLTANAILLAYNCAPLSYRSVDEEEYRAAAIVFYELNSIMPMKKIFINQYLFAAQNYSLIP
jgi:fido (protein-threonine AMPylation protein)